MISGGMKLIDSPKYMLNIRSEIANLEQTFSTTANKLMCS